MSIKKDEFLLSRQLKLNLLTVEKKMTQLRHVLIPCLQRYVIEVITDNHVDQVKKTFR